MIRLRATAAALLAAGTFAAASPTFAQGFFGPAYRDVETTGSLRRDPNAPPASRYEADGNAKAPRALNVPGAPAWQQGSGQETGGPARELIPSDRW